MIKQGIPRGSANTLASREYRANDTLRDGESVEIRAIRPDDKQRLLNAFYRLTRWSVYFRFFGPKQELTSEDLAYFTEVDFRRHVALVAVIPTESTDRIVGVGRYVEIEEPRATRSAEVAFTVDDAHQGRGIGTLLLKHLTIVARYNGIQVFEAMVLANNDTMLDLFAHSGLALNKRIESDGVLCVSFPIA